MHTIIGWLLGLILAVLILVVFEVKEPIAAVLISWFFTMAGTVIAQLLELE